MAPLRRLTPGEKLRALPAGTWNQFCDTAQRVAQLPPPANGSGQSAGSNALTCLVFNESGGDISADFPVLRLDKPTYTTADGEDAIHKSKAFDGKTPDGNTQPTDIAIVQGPIKSDESRSAVIVGPTWCKIEFTDETHTRAAPKTDDNTKLASSGSGLKILWHEELPDAEYLPATVWAMVLLGVTAITRPSTGFVTSSTLTAANMDDFAAIVPGTGEVRRWTLSGSTWGISEPVTVRNWLPEIIAPGTAVLIMELDTGLAAFPACDVYTGYAAWSAANEEEES